MTKIYANRDGKYIELSLGGFSTDGTDPWKITTAARKAAFVALAKDALARL
jgi:hypothetical protein